MAVLQVLLYESFWKTSCLFTYCEPVASYPFHMGKIQAVETSRFSKEANLYMAYMYKGSVTGDKQVLAPSI